MEEPTTSLTEEVRPLLNRRLDEWDKAFASGTLSGDDLIKFAVGTFNDLRRALIILAEAIDADRQKDRSN